MRDLVEKQAVDELMLAGLDHLGRQFYRAFRIGLGEAAEDSFQRDVVFVAPRHFFNVSQRRLGIFFKPRGKSGAEIHRAIDGVFLTERRVERCTKINRGRRSDSGVSQDV